MWRKGTLLQAGWNANWYSDCGKHYGGTSKIKNRTTIRSSKSTPEYLPKENKSTNSKRYTHSYVHCDIDYNSQDMEAA